MPKMISGLYCLLNELLAKLFTVSEAVKEFGGFGIIHGSICDISGLSHIYVNLFDNTITAYYALSMVDKTVFKSIEDLLKCKESELYKKFKDLSEDSKAFKINNESIKDNIKLYENYESTDIYSSSLLFKKMQWLFCGTLTVWFDKLLNKELELSELKQLLLESR